MPSTSKLKVAQKPQESTIINIRAIYPSILKYTGLVTGKQYIWNGAGDVVGVDHEDAPYLLSKRIGGRSCCGVQQNGNKLFERVEESA